MQTIQNWIHHPNQIIGRGTRLFEDKFYFTIVDFVGAYKKFSDPDWDGPGLPPGPPKPPPPPQPPKPPKPPKEKIIIKLAKGNPVQGTTIDQASTHLCL